MTDKESRAITTPNFYIDEHAVDVLIGRGGWKVEDIPLDVASRIRKHLGNSDVLAVFSSGIKLPPISQSGHPWRVGIDVVRIESKPKRGEPHLNVYHYAVGNRDASGLYPAYEIEDGGLAPHWADLEDLEIYYKAK